MYDGQPCVANMVPGPCCVSRAGVGPVTWQPNRRDVCTAVRMDREPERHALSRVLIVQDLVVPNIKTSLP